MNSISSQPGLLQINFPLIYPKPSLWCLDLDKKDCYDFDISINGEALTQVSETLFLGSAVAGLKLLGGPTTSAKVTKF